MTLTFYESAEQHELNTISLNCRLLPGENLSLLLPVNIYIRVFGGYRFATTTEGDELNVVLAG